MRSSRGLEQLLQSAGNPVKNAAKLPQLGAYRLSRRPPASSPTGGNEAARPGREGGSVVSTRATTWQSLPVKGVRTGPPQLISHNHDQTASPVFTPNKGQADGAVSYDGYVIGDGNSLFTLPRTKLLFRRPWSPQVNMESSSRLRRVGLQGRSDPPTNRFAVPSHAGKSGSRRRHLSLPGSGAQCVEGPGEGFKWRARFQTSGFFTMERDSM